MGGMGLRLKPWRLPMFTRGQYLAARCEKLSPVEQLAPTRRAPLGLAPGAVRPPLQGPPPRLRPWHRLQMALEPKQLLERRPLLGADAGDVDW